MVTAASAGKDWDVFVSYTAADRNWAEWIAWQLEEDGHRVLVQAWDMVPGTNWVHSMQEGVRRAGRTVAVLSEAYLNSVFAAAEWESAWRQDPLGEQRRLLVFRVADCERPGLLGGVVGVDLFDVDDTTARDRIRAAVRGALVGRAKPVTEPRFPSLGGVRQPTPRYPGALPEIWNVPMRNPNFSGRSTELGHLRSRLAEHPAVTVQALRGMGGVGKTQTVIEYAHRNAADYDLVWWINAERSALTTDQFGHLAQELGLPSPADPADLLRVVHRALRTRDRWLLIFDNAERPEDIGPLLPGGPGHVLVTTRHSGFGTISEVLELDILERPDSVALLCRRARALTGEHAELLAARLGDLALALDQAAAYLDSTGIPPEEYLGLLDTRAADLHRRGHPAGHRATIATVWSVSMEQLQAAVPAAVQLMEVCAWLGPEAIPLDLFTAHRDLLPEPLARTAADPIDFNDTVGTLTDYALARRSGSSLTFHRLVQDVTRTRSPGRPAATGSTLPTALALLCVDLPSDIWATPENWPRWETLLPSVLAATAHHAEADTAQPTARLLGNAATYLRRQGRHSDGLLLHRRALEINETLHGPAHPAVADNLADLGWVLADLGRAEEALPVLRRALRIHEAALGPDHLSVADDLNHMGWSLAALGRPDEALPLHRRALRIHEAALGPDDPAVATDLDHAGRALADTGRPGEALPLHHRALQINETTLGPEHPAVAVDLNHVGRVLTALGRTDEALPFHERALRIDERALGPEHPSVAGDLDLVSRTLTALGRAEDATPFQQRSSRIREALRGSDDPEPPRSGESA